jgi:hypothetical protein
MKISANAYAKHRGVSLQAVLKAIREGRLPTSAVQRESGRWDIDPEVADVEWQQNTDSGQGAPAHAKNRQDQPEPTGDDEPEDGEPITYAQARAQHERFKARLAQLELEQREGKLVEADVVKREAFRTARLVRDALLNLPDRIAAELANETNQFKVHQRLVSEIRRALEDLKIE